LQRRPFVILYHTASHILVLNLLVDDSHVFTATPKTEQSLAYLLRNEILTNIEDLQAEFPYLIQHPEESDEDLRTYATNASNAMKRYLDVVPPNELKQANELLTASSSAGKYE